MQYKYDGGRIKKELFTFVRLHENKAVNRIEIEEKNVRCAMKHPNKTTKIGANRTNECVLLEKTPNKNSQSETLNYNFIAEMIKWLFDYKVLFILLFFGILFIIFRFHPFMMYTVLWNLKCIAARLMRQFFVLFWFFFTSSSAHTSARVCRLWFSLHVSFFFCCVAMKLHRKAVSDKTEEQK